MEWSPSRVTDPDGLDSCLGVVAEKVHADGALRKAIRVLLGWLAEGKQNEALLSLGISSLPAEKARVDASVAAGITAACDLLTDESQLRGVRDWLHQKPEDENAG